LKPPSLAPCLPAPPSAQLRAGEALAAAAGGISIEIDLTTCAPTEPAPIVPAPRSAVGDGMDPPRTRTDLVPWAEAFSIATAVRVQVDNNWVGVLPTASELLEGRMAADSEDEAGGSRPPSFYGAAPQSRLGRSASLSMPMPEAALAFSASDVARLARENEGKDAQLTEMAPRRFSRRKSGDGVAVSHPPSLRSKANTLV